MTGRAAQDSRTPIPSAAEGEALRRQLEAAAAEWRTTFDALASPVLVLDAAGTICRLNRAARDLTSHDFAGLIGRPAAAVGGGPLFALAAELAATAAGGSGPAAIRVADPGTGAVWSVVARLRQRGPEVDDERVIVVASDITRLEALQERLRQQDTLAALGATVAGLAHQVRNPLFGITAALDALDARYGTDGELQRYVAALRTPVGRLSALLSELVEYAVAPVTSPESVDLRAVAAAAIRAGATLAAQRGVALAAPAPGAAVPVRVDGHRLQTALHDLIENALQMSPAGGTVEVDVAAAAAAGADGGRVRCRVRDHGPGFRAEDLPRLGEPFFSRRHGATGLGLALVRRVATESGGTVTFANHPEGGAEVELRLPLAAAAEKGA